MPHCFTILPGQEFCQLFQFCFSAQDSSWPLVVVQGVPDITNESAQGHPQGAMDLGQDTPDKCVFLCLLHFSQKVTSN